MTPGVLTLYCVWSDPSWPKLSVYEKFIFKRSKTRTEMWWTNEDLVLTDRVRWLGLHIPQPHPPEMSLTLVALEQIKLNWQNLFKKNLSGACKSSSILIQVRTTFRDLGEQKRNPSPGGNTSRLWSCRERGSRRGGRDIISPHIFRGLIWNINNNNILKSLVSLCAKYVSHVCACVLYSKVVGIYEVEEHTWHSSLSDTSST